MTEFLARAIHSFDRFLPRTRVEGRESPEAYSDWEYRLGCRLLGEYADFFGDLEGKLILDAGCGLGGKTVAYSERGAVMEGIDINPQHIEWARDFCQAQGSSASFQVADAENLPFPANHFDHAVANDAMEHFPHPELALAEFSRVLKPGGRLFLFFTPWGSPLGSHLYDWIHTPWCHLLFSEKLLERLIDLEEKRRGNEDHAGEAARQMESYRTTLNHINIAGFHRLLGEHDELELLHEELIVPRYRFLQPLTRVPLIRELFTNTVVAILQKQS